MINRRNFLSTCASALALVASWRPGWAQTTATANVTFILFNDFYLMGEQPFPDGKTRGGFARLAAIIKTERTKAAAAGAQGSFDRHRRWRAYRPHRPCLRAIAAHVLAGGSEIRLHDRHHQGAG